MKKCELCGDTFKVGHDKDFCTCGGKWTTGEYLGLKREQVEDTLARLGIEVDPKHIEAGLGEVHDLTHESKLPEFSFSRPSDQYIKLNVPGQRGQVLLDAHQIINGERQDVYGSPEDSFALIAQYWNTYLKSRSWKVAKERSVDHLIGEFVDIVTAQDVALMMTLFKVAREANQHKRDNIVDAAGYLGIYGSMQG